MPEPDVQKIGICQSFFLSSFSRSAKLHDVIVLPYTRVQIAHARYVHTLLLAVRDKMAADFLLMFVKLPERCAYFLQTLVDRSLKSKLLIMSRAKKSNIS